MRYRVQVQKILTFAVQAATAEEAQDLALLMAERGPGHGRLRGRVRFVGKTLDIHACEVLPSEPPSV